MDDSTQLATAKIGVAWFGVVLGNLNLVLSTVALLLTIIFTALQISKLLRDRKKAREESAAFAAKITAPSESP